MSDSESQMYTDFKKWVPGDHRRIEDVNGGVPDLNYCIPGENSGWIECKFLEQWPVRSDTPVKLRFKPGQIAFLVSRGQMGKAFLWARIGIEEFFFRGIPIMDIGVGVPKEKFISYSFFRCTRKDKLSGLLDHL